MVRPKVVPRFVEEFRENGMKRDFVETVWNRFKPKSADLKLIPSIKEQRVFVQDTANRCNEIEGETEDSDEDWSLEDMVSVDDVVAFTVRDKLKKIQSICEDESKAVPTSVVKVVELSRLIFETKRKNAKLAYRVSDPERELEDMWSIEELARVSLEVATTRVQALEAEVKNANAKNTKVVDKATKAEKDLRFRMFLSEASLKAKRDCVVNIASDSGAPVGRPGDVEATRRRLQERNEALREANKEWTATCSELESLRCTSRDLEEESVTHLSMRHVKQTYIHVRTAA